MRFIFLVIFSNLLYLAVMAQSGNAAAAAGNHAAPQPLQLLDADLPEGIFQYQGYLEIQGQRIDAFVTRNIRHQANLRMVINEVSLMGQTSYDTSVYSYPGLQCLSRSLGQGSMNTVVTNSEGKVTITHASNGTSKTQTLEYSGNYLNSGAGMDMLIARLPLAQGFATEVVTADPATQTIKKMKIGVTGTESINGKPCTVVTMVNASNETERNVLYINIDRKLAVKIEQTLPMANNARTSMMLKD
jgi:hypothetical protein